MMDLCHGVPKIFVKCDVDEDKEIDELREDNNQTIFMVKTLYMRLIKLL